MSIKTESYIDIMKEKFKRRDQIKEIEYHAEGHCIHIGKISPGCRQCFTGELGGGIQVGQECMYSCPMCYYDRRRKNEQESQRSVDKKLSDFFFQSMDPLWKPISYSYQSTGETLLYIDQLAQFSAILQKVCYSNKVNMYHHLYTNGILINKERLEKMKMMNVHELRFHVSASGFNKVLADNMYLAAKEGFIITIEEPSWDLHKKDLFEWLKILDDCGGKHLDMVEVQITRYNLNDISRYYPNGRMFKDHFYHLYDEGFVFDVMEEVIAKGYKFSVLECNSGVERCRHAKYQHIGFDMNSINGMCAPWDYFSYKGNFHDTK